MRDQRKIRVMCTRCGKRGWHQMGGTCRLRHRKCSNCGGRGRPLWWYRKYRQAAALEVSPEVAKILTEISL